MKILIVDDKQENLYLLETMLKGTGHEVVSARNGLEALEKLKGIEVDMIIADILMPEMDGFQLCKTVKSDDIFGRIPFVFYTASYTEDRDEELAYKVGADKYIRKPVEPDVFIKIIHGIIEDSRDQKLTPHKPAAENEEAILKLYNERLVAKLQQKRIALEQEIEERKKTEANLRKSEEQYRNLIEEINDVVFSVNEQGVITFISPLIAQIAGYAPDDILGRPFIEFIHEDDLVRIQGMFTKLKTGHIEPSEYRIITKSGGHVHVRSSSKPVFGAGMFRGIRGLLTNITGEKKLEEDRDRLFNLSTDMLCIAGFDGFFKQLNPAWEKTLGWTGEELRSKPWLDFVHPEDHKATSEAGRNLISGEIVVDLVNRYRCKNGSYKWISWNSNPLPEEQLIFSVAHDVTETVKAREEIQQRVTDLENFYQMAIGRELRMKELKEEIADLKEKLAQCTGGKSREEDE